MQLFKHLRTINIFKWLPNICVSTDLSRTAENHWIEGRFMHAYLKQKS